MSPGERVSFNLEDADLPELMRLISEFTGKRFILPGKLRQIKATVYAPTKVSVAEAYEAFLSVLQLNGMTLVPSGRYFKIVESTNIETQPITTYTGNSPTPTNDAYITRLHRLENVGAEDVAALMARFKSAEGQVTAYAPTNTLIITDTGTNIRRMLRILEAIDVPRTGEQIWIEPVHYADASELAARLTEIFPVGQAGATPGTAPARPVPPQPGGNPGMTNVPSSSPTTIGSRGGGESRITKILADERTNSLIILATERAYLRILELIRQLDVPLEGEGRIHVHYIQHGDAEEVATTLTSLVGGGGARPPGGAPGQAGGAGVSAAVFEGEIRVTAHAPTNALVITSSLHDYAALRSVIDRLDVRRRQVFIEAVIMDLAVNRTRDLGLSFHGGVPDFPEGDALTVLGFNAQTSTSLGLQDILTGFAVGVRGPTIPDSQQLIGVSVPAFGVVLTALAASEDANVLSTPHIIAMDNEEAEITVGENVPLQTSGVAGLGSLGGLGALAGLGGQTPGATPPGGIAGLAGLAGLAGGGFGGAVPRQDVGTTVRLTPHVNESDEVLLELQVEDSRAGDPDRTGNLGVVPFSKRSAKTSLVVRDQQTVVIGGLMRDSHTTSEERVPILGDIPLLGMLFRQTHRVVRKTNLLIFLTPYIIREPADLRSIFERKMRERQEFIDRYFLYSDEDYEPPLDYSRTRGLVGEIIAELHVADEEARLASDALARPPPDHVARPPVGAAPGETVEEGDLVITPEGTTAVAAPDDSEQE